MIQLTREVRFSADRDWDPESFLRSPVANSWAGWPAAPGLSPYLRLQATVAGEPDPVSGYLCNITLIDDLLRGRALPLVLRQMGERGAGLTVERVLRSLWEQLAPEAPAAARLIRLRLFPTPYLHYTVRRERPEVIQLTEQFEFSAAHRLHCPELTDEQNRALFGKCNNPRGHGHNYVLDVTVSGIADPASGLVCARQRLQQVVKQRVIDRFDHKHLNEDTEEFRRLNPTVENLAQVIWNLLWDRLPPARLERIRVYETPKTWADFQGPAR
jgi:6-pyruvoyltetrahydropterin/6-carboxytetrahydropterin synthase